MSFSEENQPFNSLTYWRMRHEKYLLDPKGVGNAVLDTEENERIYRAVDGYIGALVANMVLKKPTRVLELGCGIGMLAGAFIRTGCNYTGVDISEKAIEIARDKHPSGNFEVANIAELPFSGTFDLIIERTVLIHLVEDDYWSSVIKEVKRLLAPDGVFVLIDHLPESQDEVPGKGEHVKFRLYNEYVKALNGVGLGFNADLRRVLATKMPLSPHTYFVTHG